MISGFDIGKRQKFNYAGTINLILTYFEHVKVIADAWKKS